MASSTSKAVPERAADPRARFALKYAAIAGTLFVIYCFPYASLGWSERWFDAYLAAYARMAGAVIGLFEPGLGVTGTYIRGRFALEVVKNCDAIEVNILYAAAIAALPGRRSERAIALGAGLALLVLANVTRIGCLYYVGVALPDWFEFAHLELWPVLLIGVAALEFVLFARWIGRDRPATASASGGAREM